MAACVPSFNAVQKIVVSLPAAAARDNPRHMACQAGTVQKRRETFPTGGPKKF